MDSRGRTYLGFAERPCETCGTIFTPTDPRTRFCSLTCRHRKTWPPPSKPCEICGVVMVKPTQGLSYADWEKRRYCSKKCLGQSYRNPKVNCAECSKAFHPIIGRKTVFCSRECFYAFRLGKTMSPEWRLAPSRKRAALGQNFTPSQKKAIRKRDGNVCRHCGSTENLQVDHIVPCHSGGTNDLDNGQVLCGSCHRLKTAEEYWNE